MYVTDRVQWTYGCESRKKKDPAAVAAASTMDTSDNDVLGLLKRIRETNDRDEIRDLFDQLERVIFHRQYASS